MLTYPNMKLMWWECIPLKCSMVLEYYGTLITIYPSKIKCWSMLINFNDDIFWSTLIKYYGTLIKNHPTGWWFQPSWKILVNGKDYPIYYGKNVPNHHPDNFDLSTCFPKKNKSAVATELLSRLVATEFQSASAGECERINYDIP